MKGILGPTHPQTRYAKSGNVSIAYQVVGDGPLDLIFVMGWVSNLDYFWEEPRFAQFLRRLASFSRLILFDKRGTGLSDRAVGMPTLEQRMDDVRAVLDAVGSERAALLGISEGGAMSVLFAATYPERTSALVLLGCFARRLWAADYPFGTSLEEQRSRATQMVQGWGSVEWTEHDLEARAPGASRDPRFVQWWDSYLRMSASPGTAAAFMEMNNQIDVRHILSAVRIPTLVAHRAGDRLIPVEMGRYIAEHIPNARYIELPGDDHLPFIGDREAVLDAVEQFLTGVRHVPEPDRVLLTLVYVDVVGPLERSSLVEDRQWRELLEAYRFEVQKELIRYRGRQLESRADRILFSFDGPARAIRCAAVLIDAAHALGLQVRAGLHTGECELVRGEIQGITVHIAARVVACAAPGDLVISSTVKDLVAGSGFRFQQVGTGDILRFPGEWRLFRVERGPDSAAATKIHDEITPAHQAPHITPREREVVDLVARGLTNRQIAEELVITEATAERHVINIFNKLGYHSRAQVAAWAVEQRLGPPDSG